MLDMLATLDLLTMLWAAVGMAVGIFLGALPGFGGSMLSKVTSAFHREECCTGRVLYG